MGFAPFGDRDVIESAIEMPGAGGGFHAALAVDNLELEHHDRVTIAVEVDVRKVRFDLVDPNDEDCEELTRVHVLKVINAAVIDRKVVAEALQAQRRKVEEAKGNQELPFADPDDDTPDVCPHDRPVGECSTCPAPAPVAAEPEAAEATTLRAVPD